MAGLFSLNDEVVLQEFEPTAYQIVSDGTMTKTQFIFNKGLFKGCPVEVYSCSSFYSSFCGFEIQDRGESTKLFARGVMDEIIGRKVQIKWLRAVHWKSSQCDQGWMVTDISSGICDRFTKPNLSVAQQIPIMRANVPDDATALIDSIQTLIVSVMSCIVSGDEQSLSLSLASGRTFEVKMACGDSVVSAFPQILQAAECTKAVCDIRLIMADGKELDPSDVRPLADQLGQQSHHD